MASIESAKNSVTSILTGDIVQSRSSENPVWLPVLKNALAPEGKSPRAWQIYRGDSFQVEVKSPEHAFLTAVRIKASIKTIKDLDVRLAIGVGTKAYVSSQLTESDGEAFVFSGETFETLKRLRRNLAIKSPWEDFDKDMNLYFQLASIPMDDWTPSSAEFILLMIQNPTLTQQQLAAKLGVTQPAVSDRQNRSHFETIMELERHFRQKILELTTSK